MTPAPLHPWPAFSEEEADAVAAVLRSNRVNYWTGQECREFEWEFAEWSGSARAIALANGTLALDLALQALGIGPGDEVIVTPRTFIASASCVVNAGATPVFADVDGDSGNISPATIAAVMTDRTRAIIPVHLGGWPCDMDGIMALAEPRAIAVIEDCAQAHGARVGERSVGSIGHVGAWSFCQDKIMTTGGEGGMVTTDDEQLWRKMWSFKDHGKDWDAVYTRAHAPGFRWVHESIGTNWRMLEMQAVLGRIQLTRMADWTAQRTANAMAYHAALSGHDDVLHLPLPGAGYTHAFYRHYIYVRPDALADGWDRDRIVAEMQAAGIPVMHGTCSEVYLEKAFDGTPWRPAQRLPNARQMGENSIMFMVQPTIDTQTAERYAALAAEVVARAKR
jgi:dTDP-4-amino-4,6-dideoxygalactose transaminase